MKVVGKDKFRVDAYGKVTGEAKYSADLEPKNVLHGKVIHSTIANGRVLRFKHLEEARKIPGVVKIITCFDVPDIQFPTAGHPWSVELCHQDIADRKLLNERVRLYGDDIAAVVAETDVACEQAARMIEVEYEEYEPIVTVDAAMSENATPLHPDKRKDNVIVHSHLTMAGEEYKGNKDEVTYEKALAQAKEDYGEDNIVTFDHWLKTPRISHSHIELAVSWAFVDVNGKVTVTSSTQIPHIVRRCVAQALGLPVGKVRVIKPYIGGGFGNKQDTLYEPLNAYLSIAVGGRAVRLELSREEVIVGTRTRHAMKGHVKGVCTKDGKLLARSLDVYANNGGYASHGHAICANCGNVFKGLYHDNIGNETDCSTVWTTSPTAGAMRAYGIPQAVWFTDCLADDLAYEIGMDPFEFRMKNCMRSDYVDPHNGIAFYSYGLKDCMKRGAEYIHWDEKRKEYANQTGPIRRGVGMAIFMYKTGVYPISLEPASSRLVLNQDGSAQLFMGATEIGQGADTVFSQMAAETTGIKFEDIYIVSTQDTDTSPFDTGAYASRQTYVSGKACKKCSESFKEKILTYAAYMLNHVTSDISKTVYADAIAAAQEKAHKITGLYGDTPFEPEMLDIIDSVICLSRGGEELFPLSMVADTAFYSLDNQMHITAEESAQCRTNAFSSGVCFVDIEVDIPLGLVKVLDIINVHDSGRIINHDTAAGQAHGGMGMGIGYGLSEEMIINEKTGKTLNDNLLDFKIPTAMDIPDLTAEFVEIDDPTGPYGNKSLGEPPNIPGAPAIRNAILHATGAHMYEIPMTAQRLTEEFTKIGLIEEL